jgi:hypothetical protein
MLFTLNQCGSNAWRVSASNTRRPGSPGAARPVRQREQPSVSVMAMAWAGGAVEQPTITALTRLAPDNIQPIIYL